MYNFTAFVHSDTISIQYAHMPGVVHTTGQWMHRWCVVRWHANIWHAQSQIITL